MKKSTAIEILRRYSDYSIVTVGRPDICGAIVDANGRPFYDTVNLVYLWSLGREEMPFEGPASLEYPVREHFALESFVDYLEEKREGMDRSPWSGKGALGGSCNGMVRLLPFDLDRVLYLMGDQVIRSFIAWTPEDDADDEDALGKGRLYADMGDWSPTRIAFDPDALRLDWDCAASAECARNGVEVEFWIQWEAPEEKDDEIEILAEMEKMATDSTSITTGGDKRPDLPADEGHVPHPRDFQDGPPLFS